MKFAQKHHIEGQRFGRVIAESHIGGGRWMCRCDCGNSPIVNAYALANGTTKSCGCLILERSKKSKSVAAARKSANLSHESLRSMLRYDEKSGIFTWLVSPRFSVPKGANTDGSTHGGYRTIGILGRHYRVHRLAWFYVHGVWPKGLVDHINGDTSDNRIVNLRDCSKAVNTQNQRKPHSGNTTGYLGVTKNGSKSKPFRAQINLDGKITYIGIFESAEEAHQAYVDRKRSEHEGCTL